MRKLDTLNVLKLFLKLSAVSQKQKTTTTRREHKTTTTKQPNNTSRRREVAIEVQVPPLDPVCWATGGALDWLYPNFYLRKQQEEQENQAKSNNTTTKQPTEQTREGKVANEVQVPPTRLRSAWDIQPHCTCLTIQSTSRRGGVLDWLYPTFYFNK